MAVAHTSAIRLLKPLRTGHQLLDVNAVVDCTPEVADLLLNHDPPLAVETDAIERCPEMPFLSVVSEAPVTGSERYPVPEGRETLIPPNYYRTEVDRRAEARALAAGPIVRSASHHHHSTPSDADLAPAEGKTKK